MAKRAQKAAQALIATAADPGHGRSGNVEHQFVVFRCGDTAFAFAASNVAEILRLPRLVHMPLSPKSLLGLANVRGTVLPVVGLSNLLGFGAAVPSETSRVVVIAASAFSVGFLVDGIDRLLPLTEDQIEKADAAGGVIDSDFLDGVVKTGEGRDAIKILNPERLLRREFSRMDMSAPRGSTIAVASAVSSAPVAAPKRQTSLVSFELRRQEYAVPLDRVREIIQLPAHISEVPRADSAVLGVVTLRDRLLPLVSLRALLGLAANSEPQERGKVVVLSMGQGSVGVVTDRTREILHVDESVIDPAPALLTRGAGDAEIVSICRLDKGKRLVALLSPDRLFRSDVMKRVISEQYQAAATEGETDEITMVEEQFVIFRMGTQEYGIPIQAVQEIARPPEHIARLPKAPPFVDGVMNLRGAVLPIVDLCRRFDVAATEQGGARRILVLAIGNKQTGFMVDGVSEVLKVPNGVINVAPDLSDEQMRLIGRVANLDAEGRMILLVDPAQLLNQVERDVLAEFNPGTPAQISKRS